MGDPYQIRIPPSVWARMSAWDLPAEVRRFMDGQLRDRLAADPVAHLVPCVAPWGQHLNLFSFTAPPECDQPSVRHMFMFHVVYGADESSLEIVECGYQRKVILSP